VHVTDRPVVPLIVLRHVKDDLTGNWKPAAKAPKEATQVRFCPSAAFLSPFLMPARISLPRCA
jgi:hypothetical protein